MWFQKKILLKNRKRGIHLVTNDIASQLSEISGIGIGLCHLLLQHTSAGLTLNENADPSVRADLNVYLDRLAPENTPYFTHTLEGADDMPAHIKSALVGSSLTIPLTRGRFNLGTWQGIYLCEFRDWGGDRTVVATIHGEAL